MIENAEYAKVKLLSFVKSMHGIPRYGHSKDVSYFFANDSELRRDYSLGLIVVFSIIMGIAAAWYLSLLVLRILGHRVGCAAGRAATIPAEPMMDNGKASVNTDETGEFIVMQGDQNRVNRTRVVFFISVLYSLAACGVLIWSLFIAQGALQDFFENAEDVKDGFIQMPESLDKAIQSSTDIVTSRNDLVLELDEFCPNPTGIVKNVTEDFKSSIVVIPNMADDSSWENLNASLPEMNDVLVDAVSFIGFLKSPKETWFIGALSATICTSICTLYLLACAWKSGKEGYEFSGEDDISCNSRVLHYCVLPLFAVLIAGSWFVTAIAFTSGAANADFCYGEISTGKTVLNFLLQLQFTESSEFYKRTDDYLHGCVDGVSATMPSGDEFHAYIGNAITNLEKFSSLDRSDLSNECTGNVTATMDKVQSFSVELNSLDSDYSRVYSHLSCESVAPLIQKNVYEISCNSMSKGFLWIFVSGLCLAVFGTIMVSLRSATQRPQIYLVSANKDELGDDDSYIVDSDDSRY